MILSKKVEKECRFQGSENIYLDVSSSFLIILFIIDKNNIFAGVESEDISAIKEFVQSVEDSLLFITMMVIAEGWGVVRCHIKHYRWTSLLCE